MALSLMLIPLSMQMLKRASQARSRNGSVPLEIKGLFTSGGGDDDDDDDEEEEDEDVHGNDDGCRGPVLFPGDLRFAGV